MKEGETRGPVMDLNHMPIARHIKRSQQYGPDFAGRTKTFAHFLRLRSAAYTVKTDANALNQTKRMIGRFDRLPTSAHTRNV